MKGIIACGMILLAGCLIARAAEISGTWQATDSGQNRHVLEIHKAADHLSGSFFNLGPERSGSWRNGNTISAVHLNGRTITFALDQNSGSFSGTITDGGKSIRGKWEAFGETRPLDFFKADKATGWVLDPSPHKTMMVEVEPGVRLEVLDWGGKGPPLVFLPGLGSTAHEFDEFAPEFIDRHHVYAITRRGFGLSSKPPATIDNYDCDRLAGDVVAVISNLKLSRPIIAGHSVAGEELGSLGTRYPEKVAGLIYLDAAYGRGDYDRGTPFGLWEDASEIIRNLKLMNSGFADEVQGEIRNIEAAIPHLQKGLKAYYSLYNGIKPQTHYPRPAEWDILDAIALGVRRYPPLKVPALVIYALPQKCSSGCDSAGHKAELALDIQQSKAFESANPLAHVVRIPFASHSVFRSNEAEVRNDMNMFMDKLR